MPESLTDPFPNIDRDWRHGQGNGFIDLGHCHGIWNEALVSKFRAGPISLSELRRCLSYQPCIQSNPPDVRGLVFVWPKGLLDF